MTQIELSTMHSIIRGMNVIAGALVKSSPRYVQVTPHAYVNPNFISSIAQLPESQDANANEGRVNVVMNNGTVYDTQYKNASELFAKLAEHT